MSKRSHLLLIAGCLVIAVLQAPSAFRSLNEGWHGAYAPGPVGGFTAEGARVTSASRADASADLALENGAQSAKTSGPILRAGF